MQILPGSDYLRVRRGNLLALELVGLGRGEGRNAEKQGNIGMCMGYVGILGMRETLRNTGDKCNRGTPRVASFAPSTVYCRLKVLGPRTQIVHTL